MTTTTAAPRRQSKTGMILVVSLIVVAWLAVMVWIAFQPQRTEGTLGMDDETEHGAAAIVSVMEDQNITVQPAQSMTQLRSALESHPHAVVVFHDKYEALQTASYERLEQLAELVPAEQRVFAGVAQSQQQYLLDGIEAIIPVPFVETVSAEANCGLPAAQEADDISAIRSTVVLADDATGCFAVTAHATGGPEESYAYAQTADGSIVFADWRMLSNAGLYDNGTATLATWALGRSDTVIWFQPDFQLDPDTDGQLSPVQLPDWARMGLVWAVIATGIWLFYRGRRTGPVIAEPLPAEVPAAETTVGRGRMHTKAGHHSHALATLQHASLARLARELQLGPSTASDAVLAEAAGQLGRPVTELQALYAPTGPHLTAQEFVDRANQLKDLEHTVRNRFSAPPKESS